MTFYKNKRLIYLIFFFHNLIPAYVIERLFWQERGMTVQIVVYCEFIYAAVIILLEIPSGVLADLIGRKKLIVISGIMPCLEIFLLIFANKFWHFGFAVFIAGIGKAFSSGAYNALLYDSLSSCGKTNEFEKIIGRINTVDFIAGTIAALSGGYLAFKFGFTFNYWLSLMSCVIALILPFFLAEPPKTSVSEHMNTWRTILKDAYSSFRDNTNILRIIIHSSVIAASIIYLDEFWQLYLEYISFPIILFGVASSVISLSRIPSAVLSANLLKYLKHETVMLLASFICGISVLLAALLPGVYGMLGIITAISMGALIEPVVMGYLHHNANDTARATMESVISLIERVLTICIGLTFGYIASRFSIISGYYLIGVFIISTSVIFSLVYKKRPRIL